MVALAAVGVTEADPSGWTPLGHAPRRQLAACAAGLFPVREGMPAPLWPVDEELLALELHSRVAELRRTSEVEVLQRVSRVEALTVERQLGVRLSRWG